MGTRIVSMEHPKHMFKVMGKKIISILGSKKILSGPMDPSFYCHALFQLMLAVGKYLSMKKPDSEHP